MMSQPFITGVVLIIGLDEMNILLHLYFILSISLQLAEILQPEQNFLLLFRSKEALRSSKEFYDVSICSDLIGKL